MSEFFFIERKSKKINSPLIILIHGYGSNERDLFSLIDYFPNDAFVVSLRAPLKLFNDSYAWYDIYLNGHKKFYDHKAAALVRDELFKFIENLSKNQNIDSENITLIGFSQGAILSHAISFSYPEKIKNIMALSGIVDEKIMKKTSLIPKTNIYISHGTNDNLIDYETSKESLNFYTGNDIEFKFESFEQGHGINQQNLESMMKWLKEKV